MNDNSTWEIDFYFVLDISGLIPISIEGNSGVT